MLHPEPGGAHSAPRPPLAADASAPDQQLPLDSADERASERTPARPDALQQARDLLAAGEATAAATTTNDDSSTPAGSRSSEVDTASTNGCRETMRSDGR